MIETKSINDCLETFKSQLVEIVDNTKHTDGFVDDLVNGIKEVESNVNALHETFLNKHRLTLKVVGDEYLSHYASGKRIGESSVNVQWVNPDENSVTPQLYTLHLISLDVGRGL
jgi:hypothetical protein